MPADSDSTIAWHRVQLKKLRQTLKDIETSRFTVGESTYANRTGKTRQTIADRSSVGATVAAASRPR